MLLLLEEVDVLLSALLLQGLRPGHSDFAPLLHDAFPLQLGVVLQFAEVLDVLHVAAHEVLHLVHVHFDAHALHFLLIALLLQLVDRVQELSGPRVVVHQIFDVHAHSVLCLVGCARPLVVQVVDCRFVGLLIVSEPCLFDLVVVSALEQNEFLLHLLGIHVFQSLVVVFVLDVELVCDFHQRSFTRLDRHVQSAFREFGLFLAGVNVGLVKLHF